MKRIGFLLICGFLFSGAAPGQTQDQPENESGIEQAQECQGIKLSQDDQEFQDIQKAYEDIHAAVLRSDLDFVTSVSSSGAEAVSMPWSDTDLQLVAREYEILFIISVPSENTVWMRVKGNAAIISPYEINGTARNAGDTVEVEGEFFFIHEDGAWKMAGGAWRDSAGIGTTLNYQDNRARRVESHLWKGWCYALLNS